MRLSRDLNHQFAFKNHWVLTVTLLATTALISTDSSLFSLIIFAGCLIWRLWIEFVSFKIPSRWITGLASVLLIALTYQQNKTLIGSDVTVTLLVGLTGLKILECSNDRDKFFLYLLCWGMVGFKFLFQVDLWILIPSSLITMVIFYLLLRDHSSLPRPRIILLHMASAIPIALFLFVIFPRNNFPLISGIGSGVTVADSAVTGFTDELAPGSIARLTRVQQTAFRVQFDKGYTPDRSSLYWRGDTLADANGLYWKKKYNLQNRDRQLLDVDSTEANFSYTTLLEPHGKNWIFTLPKTTSASSKEISLVQNRSSNFSSMSTLYRNISYRAIVNPKSRMSPSVPEEYLSTPEVSAEIKKLVAPILRLKTRKQKVQALLNIFRKGSFSYSLTPGTMDSLDEFLLTKKVGFCEHYSAAFATLARAVQIPARVVVGYQGGEYNSVGNFWTISQSDAHAWVEIVDDTQSWSAVDPTAIVSPERVHRGSGFAGGFAAQFLNADRFSVISLFFGSISNFFEDLNFRWNILLIEFDSEYRQLLISYLKLFFEQSLLPAGFVFIALWWLAKRLRKRYGNRGQAFQKVFRNFEAWGKQQGFARLNHEPPLQYCARLAMKFPKIRSEIEILANAYDQATYADHKDSYELKKMRRSLRKIKSA